VAARDGILSANRRLDLHLLKLAATLGSKPAPDGLDGRVASRMRAIALVVALGGVAVAVASRHVAALEATGTLIALAGAGVWAATFRSWG
jgi:hypothetical protein